jgi:multidrug efflux system outer membrane protein
VRNLTRAAQDQYFATRQARDAAQITLVSEVAADYLILGSDRALLQIARDSLKNGTETLKVTTYLFENGIDTELDVNQAETFVDQARFDVARLTTLVA